MPTLDEVLERGLREATPAREPMIVGEAIERRRRRKRLARRAATVVLALAMIGATLGGVAVLNTGFADRGGTPATPPIEPVETLNGRLLVTTIRSVMWVDPEDGSTEPLQLPNEIAGDSVWGASFSPDGSQLALQVFPTMEDRRSIWLFDLPTGEARQLIAADNVSVPSWSPDGSMLVLSVEERDRSTIQIVRADGSDEWQVAEETEPGISHFSAAFSPDGTRVGYGVGTDARFDLASIALDGSDVQTLTTGGKAYQLAWGPDSQIAFTRQEAPMESDLFLMDADGSNVRRLTHGGRNVTNLGPVWSPDGTEIAYNLNGGNGEGGLAVVPVTGAEPRILLPHGTGVLGVAWEPVPTARREAPTEDVDAGAATRVAGVPFRVCRPMSIPGDYGDGLDSVWLFEEWIPGVGCVGPSGTYRIGIGTADRVTIISDPIEDLGHNGVTPWLFATPELSGIVDEIAIGVDGSKEAGFASVVPFQLVPGSVGGEYVVSAIGIDCGAACEPGPWISVGTVQGERTGAYCEVKEDGTIALIHWFEQEESLAVSWSLRGRTLFADGLIDLAGVTAPDGTEELCGSRTFWPEDFGGDSLSRGK